MKKLTIILLTACIGIIAAASLWQPDYLGDGYEMRYVDQGHDYSGKVRSTIIRKQSDCGGNRGILYVHGYNDYFFQREMGDRFADSCINFYAVDLRKYGRSITDGQKKFEARDMHEYFADIDSALSQMHRDGIDDIMLMGHSTGGLITSLYMNEAPDSTIRGLILNSPFLDWNFTGFMRKVAIPVFGSLGKLFPHLSITQGGSGYQKSLLKKWHGEWDYNQDWKVMKPEKTEASWVRAISNAQNELNRHGNIAVPILLMHSSGSLKGEGWTPEYQKNDVVLDVNHISQRGRKLGADVTEATIKDGMHDLILSSPESREQAYNTIFDWLHNIN